MLGSVVKHTGSGRARKKQYFKNEYECFIGVSNKRKLMKARGRRPSAFIVFDETRNPDETRNTSF